MLIPRRTVRTSQPQYLVGVDWQKPQARGLLAQIGALPSVSRDATGRNRVYSIGSPRLQQTERGPAIALGDSSGLYIPSNPTVDLPVNHSVSAWIRIDSTPTFHSILNKGTTGLSWNSYDFGIGVTAGGQQKFGYRIRQANSDSPRFDVHQPGYITTTGWFHVVATHDGSTLSLYVNGKLEATESGSSSAPYLNTSRCFVGGAFDNALAYAGQTVHYPIQDVRLYSRCLSASDVAADYLNPWQIFEDEEDYVFVPAAGGGDATVNPGLLTNGSTIYAPAFVPGAVAANPALLTNSSSLYAPAIQTATSVNPDLLTNSASLYAPTFVAGSVAASPALLTNGNTLYGPSFEPGAVSVSPSLLSNVAALYAPTMVPGAATATPDLLANAATLFAPTINQDGTINPSLLANSNVLYSPTIQAGAVSVSPGLLINSPAVNLPTFVPGAVSVSPSLYTNASTAYSITVSVGQVNVYPAPLNNANDLYTPGTSLASGPQTVIPGLLTNAQQFYSATVVPGTVTLFPVPLVNTGVLFAPSVWFPPVGGLTLTPDDIAAVAAAVLAALRTASPFVPVDVQTMNGSEVVGDGSEPDPWRGLGVSP